MGDEEAEGGEEEGEEGGEGEGAAKMDKEDEEDEDDDLGALTRRRRRPAAGANRNSQLSDDDEEEEAVGRKKKGKKKGVRWSGHEDTDEEGDEDEDEDGEEHYDEGGMEDGEGLDEEDGDGGRGGGEAGADSPNVLDSHWDIAEYLPQGAQVCLSMGPRRWGTTVRRPASARNGHPIAHPTIHPPSSLLTPLVLVPPRPPPLLTLRPSFVPPLGILFDCRERLHLPAVPKGRYDQKAEGDATR